MTATILKVNFLSIFIVKRGMNSKMDRLHWKRDKEIGGFDTIVQNIKWYSQAIEQSSFWNLF